MKVRTIGGRLYCLCTKKITGEKCLLLRVGESWKIGYCGTASGLNKYLKKLRKNAEKAEARGLIADMCGTSYRAACEDMGLSRI